MEITFICALSNRSGAFFSLGGVHSYEPDTDTFKKIVDTFGKTVVGDDGTINRRVGPRIEAILCTDRASSILT